MSILVNKTNGQVILMKKTSRAENKVYYTVYDNGICFANGKYLLDTNTELNISYVPDIPMGYNDLMAFLGTKSILEKYSSFEEGESGENWVFAKGSTGLDTTVRVLLPSDLIGKELYTGSPIDLLMQAMSPITAWSTRGENSVVQYLEELLPEHRSILDMYSSNGIVIEEKIIPTYTAIVFVYTSDGENQVPVENAIVTINGVTQYTNVIGHCEFPGLVNNVYSYEVKKDEVSSSVIDNFVINGNNLEFTVVV